MKKKEGFQGQRSYVLPAALLHDIQHHPLCRGLYITDIGYYPKARYHNRERKKGISRFVVIYCVQGEGWYQVQRLPKQVVTANQLFVLPAHVAHRYRASETNPWTIYWLHFAGSEAEAFYQHVQGNEAAAPLLVAPGEERLRLFEELFANTNMVFDSNNLAYASQCLRHWLSSFARRQPLAGPAAEPDTISQSRQFMAEHLHRPLTLAELAGQAGLSVSHYSALFRQQTQNSPLTFFSLLKMQKACQLLVNTNDRIKEIALRLGYDDPYYFSRVFTKLMSMSPREFRQSDKA